MKRVYIDFEMNMPSVRNKRDMLNADIIAIGAIQYDTDTGNIEEFKSLIKPVTNQEIYPHIEELTHIKQDDVKDAPTYEEVMRKFKKWLGTFSQIEGIYTFGNLDLTCFNNTDKKSAQKNNHPRFINNIKGLFVDIKDKYLKCGIKCMNYVSLKNLLECANVEFKGDAHDPLYDAYNLYVLDEVLEKNEGIRDILIIKDFIRPPFIILNENLEKVFDEYTNIYYKNPKEASKFDISIEVIKTVYLYLESINNIDIYNIDIIRDISRKMDTIDKLKDIRTGHFYILENIYFDMKDLIDDLMLYKLKQEEYVEEINSIINLFSDDLKYEEIEFDYILEKSC
ncbi:exonuclease domain-containing protein [Romboutsia sp. 1001216sp1]|uniref:3'-5' exonuclease n=1 Tax=unclassified Romboutsia TaxID=2626894 RepID=UPI0018AA61B9|nr:MULTISPECIES: 3'-5' exonuclease [unclassified Romboutsia]MDB8792299.1 exonuclease domain-containing protein [Romboutsia sp. 1001216sp1]MDB8795594.1 exonuclease domain-containing protein [Romboutsia sp. 1001216sp1]MDB8798527.1 exonuclease domain-containing protein [Romboutsia sp. 1001216sp1]